MKLFTSTIICIIFSSTCLLASSDTTGNEKYNSTKELISHHVEFTKITLEKQCKKLKKKIHKLEKKLSALESSSNELNSNELNKNRMKTIEAIQKCEDQIEKLNQLKSSADIIN